VTLIFLSSYVHLCDSAVIGLKCRCWCRWNLNHNRVFNLISNPNS